MCGICGVIQIGGAPREVIAPEVLDRMVDVMAHRGPNDRGVRQSAGWALAARRLSIVDVEGGHQPLANEGETIWAVQNGELYNHGELRRSLQEDRHVFTSRCDTEVLPHLFERVGLDLPLHLRGKFALAVVDPEQRCALLARDRLGVKPLYYARVDDLLVFASELKSVLASGLIDPELDLAAISAYLQLGFVPAPRTPLIGVHKLLPGHRLVVHSDSMTVDRYWGFPHPDVSSERLADRDYADALLELLDEAVQLRLMSDVPLGAMLSGGIDSSLIVALMARRGGVPVKTFSVGFAGSAVNELPMARLIAERLGTEHHEVELSLTESSVDLEDLIWHLDEPLADLSAIGFRALSEFAAQHVTVALSGQGADELFGGYSRYVGASLAGTLGRLPAPARSAVRTVLAARGTRGRRVAALVGAGDNLGALIASRTIGEDALLRRLLREPLHSVRGKLLEDARTRFYQLPPHPLDAMLFVDGQYSLPDDMLHYFDRMSMAHSLEVRVPFLDHHVVEYAARIPRSVKVSGRTTKLVIRELAQGLLPDYVIEQPKVGFFNAAVGEWFRAQIADGLDDYLLRPEARSLDFLERDEVGRLLSACRSSESGLAAVLLLRVLMLELWLSSFLPRSLRIIQSVPSYQ